MIIGELYYFGTQDTIMTPSSASSLGIDGVYLAVWDRVLVLVIRCGEIRSMMENFTTQW